MTEFARILELGNCVLTATDDELVERANSYNLELELLLGKFAGTGRELQKNEREFVQSLMEQHAKILQQMESTRDAVGAQLREVQKKTQGIRRYFDQQAPRGGFSGTKKG